MKKLVSLILFYVLICANVIGCSNEKEYKYPFVDVRWTRSTEADTEYISFYSNGEFSYYCACGNPVNDSDLCTGYSYNDKTKIITLSYMEKTEDTVTKIAVIKCTKTELVLDFGGDVRMFKADKETVSCDTITHNGKEYSLIEFPDDVFFYDLATEIECEEDVVYDIPHDKWSVIYCNGDLFALSSDLPELISNYSERNNYEWSVIIESVNDDVITEINLSLTNEEIEFWDAVDSLSRDETVFFDDIEIFGTLLKTSKDGLIAAKTDLLYHNDTWYWRTETIDDSTEGWPEYVIKLPESLNEKIKTEP